jgi:hypothetical protein
MSQVDLFCVFLRYERFYSLKNEVELDLNWLKIRREAALLIPLFFFLKKN